VLVAGHARRGCVCDVSPVDDGSDPEGSGSTTPNAPQTAGSRLPPRRLAADNPFDRGLETKVAGPPLDGASTPVPAALRLAFGPRLGGPGGGDRARADCACELGNSISLDERVIGRLAGRGVGSCATSSESVCRPSTFAP
jgi:hypothetical protein